MNFLSAKIGKQQSCLFGICHLDGLSLADRNLLQVPILQEVRPLRHQNLAKLIQCPDYPNMPQDIVLQVVIEYLANSIYRPEQGNLKR